MSSTPYAGRKGHTTRTDHTPTYDPQVLSPADLNTPGLRTVTSLHLPLGRLNGYDNPLPRPSDALAVQEFTVAVGAVEDDTVGTITPIQGERVVEEDSIFFGRAAEVFKLNGETGVLTLGPAATTYIKEDNIGVSYNFLVRHVRGSYGRESDFRSYIRVTVIEA